MRKKDKKSCHEIRFSRLLGVLSIKTFKFHLLNQQFVHYSITACRKLWRINVSLSSEITIYCKDIYVLVNPGLSTIRYNYLITPLYEVGAHCSVPSLCIPLLFLINTIIIPQIIYNFLLILIKFFTILIKFFTILMF